MIVGIFNFFFGLDGEFQTSSSGGRNRRRVIGVHLVHETGTVSAADMVDSS